MAVVYVHGLWLSGHEGVLLRRRLARALGAETHAFGYPSVRGSITDNAIVLGRYLRAIRADIVHLVAHSLGGLVVLRLFELEALVEPSALGELDALNIPAMGALKHRAPLPPGRIVLLGSPVRGCRSAHRLARLPFGKTLLGRAAADALLAERERHWDGARDLGVIAGDWAFGAGRLLGRLDAPSDGTVLVEETALPGASAQLRLHVSHSGLPFSAAVAEQTAEFLRSGRFRGI